jgi:phosphoglycerate dehydrogenase-like enzyme
MTKNTIVVLGDPGEPQLALLRERLAGIAIINGNSTDAFVQAAAQATVLFNWSGSNELFRKVFAMCPNLVWVHSRAAGLDKMFFPELRESSVPLTNGSGVFSASLGEFTLAAILYFAKDFRRMLRNQMAGTWEAFDVLPVAGQTVGIIGYGDIGRAIAARVRPLGMSVLAMRRDISPLRGADELVEQLYGPAQRIEMISRCDYVVIAAPLTAQTRGMIGEQELAAMKPTAVVINVGRGPVIDEKALVNALSSGRIKGAALDVFDQEPLPAGHPFYALENVLLSPHCADHTPDWLDQAMLFFIAQFETFQKDHPLRNVVDKNLGY